MKATHKKCPMCAETIPLAAVTCEYCGAQFEVTSTGYCQTCHDVREADGNGQCKVCGNAVVDFHVESKLIEEPVRESIPVSQPVAQTETTKTGKSRLLIGILTGIVIFAVIGILLWFGRNGLPNVSSLVATITPTTTATFSATPKPTLTATFTTTLTPTPASVEYMPVNVTAKDFYNYANRRGQPGLLMGKPEQMINGVINQQWESDGWTGNAHQDLWVMFEFDKPVNLNLIVVYSQYDGVEKTYYIQASMDGINWSNIFAGKVTTASREISKFTFDEIQTKYIRFADIDTDPDNNPSFTEVKFFGVSGSSQSGAKP